MLSLWFGYETINWSVLRPFSVEVVVHELDSIDGDHPTPEYSFRTSVWHAVKVYGLRNLLGVEVFGHTVR
tara:strand:- start:532 stop:741 length:210 start_codon:yes stop_codon:yes gene_type:complete